MADQFNILDQSLTDLMLADKYLLAAGGEYAMERGPLASSSALASGSMYVTYFRAKKTEPITKIAVETTGTAAGATPTLVRMGIFSVGADDGLTALLAAITSDTALLSVANTKYQASLTSTFSKVRGTRYACGLLVVTGAALPTMVGWPGASAQVGTDLAVSPKVTGVVTGQTDLPSSVAAASVVGNSRGVQFEMAP